MPKCKKREQLRKDEPTPAVKEPVAAASTSSVAAEQPELQQIDDKPNTNNMVADNDLTAAIQDLYKESTRTQAGEVSIFDQMECDVNKVKPPSPNPPSVMELESATSSFDNKLPASTEEDMESCETKSAIEHLTNNESDFLSRHGWETESATASIGSASQTAASVENMEKNLAESLEAFFGDDFDEFKEDSKEDSARETLNLVEKLRLELARKKTIDVDGIASAPTPDVAIDDPKMAGEVDRNSLNDDKNTSLDSIDPTIDTNSSSMDKEQMPQLEMQSQQQQQSHAMPSPMQTQQQQQQPPQLTPHSQHQQSSMMRNNLDMFNSFAVDMLQSAATAGVDVASMITPEKSLPITDSISINTDTQSWLPAGSQSHSVSGDRVSSPYRHEDEASMMNRWSENVMIPSRRSDCSSTSTSSAASSSGSSSAYCGDMLPHAGQTAVDMMRSVAATVANDIMQSSARNEQQQQMMQQTTPTSSQLQQQQQQQSLMLQQQQEALRKSTAAVADLLRPVDQHNDNHHYVNAIADNLYSTYREHMSSLMAGKMPPYDTHQSTRPSSLFPGSSFDPSGGYQAGMSKPYEAPLMIQTPSVGAAAASFTSTSLNMAFVSSIISPIPPINTDDTTLADGGTASTPTTDESSSKLDTPTPRMNSIKDMFDGSLVAADDKDKENGFNNSTIGADDLVNDISPLNDTKSSSSIGAAVAATPSPVTTPAVQKSDIEKTIDEVAAAVSEVPPAVVPVSTSTPRVDSAAATIVPPSPSPKLPPHSAKKSPTKPTRASARVLSQNKSPIAKSPLASGVSPARLPPVVAESPSATPSATTKTANKSTSRKNHRNNNRTGGQRNRGGRGRGRGRNSNPAGFFYREWESDTTAKLAGTVYDFDGEDEIGADNFENLRAMREERRKSTDTVYSKLSTPSKETCYSPKFASPSSQQPAAASPRPTTKRSSKSSAAATAAGRASHRSQLSPLCEIGNNGRIITKDYRDAIIAPPPPALPQPEDDDEEEEEEDIEATVPDEEEEDDEEEEVLHREKSSRTATTISSSSAANAAAVIAKDKTAAGPTTSPTLPQPPVQSAAAVEQFAAVQPLLPGPVDMRTYSGGSSYDAQNRIDSHNEDDAYADITPVSATDPFATSKTASSTAASAPEPVNDLVDALEKEIERYSSLPTATAGRSAKRSPADVRSAAAMTSSTNADYATKIVDPSAIDITNTSAASANATAASSNHFVPSDTRVNRVLGEATATIIEDDSPGQSRNQLKMKIKGPYSDANYVPITTSATAAGTVSHPSIPAAAAAAAAQATAPNEFNMSGGNLNVSGSVSAATAASSYNRRMRKKELLRQYCTQQDNPDECANDMMAVANAVGIMAPAAVPNETTSSMPAPNQPPPKSAVQGYKLPKAVASMTTIPTKEDYKALIDAATSIDKKKRGKDKYSAASSIYDLNNESGIGGAFSSSGIGANNSNVNSYNNAYYHNNPAKQNYGSGSLSVTLDKKDTSLDANSTGNGSDNHVTKRKSRGGNSSCGAPPKLKIKIGNAPSVVAVENNSVAGNGSGSNASGSTFEDKNLRLRPPKKRLCDSADKQPSAATVEQLKRESMRYRSKVSSEFENCAVEGTGSGRASRSQSRGGSVVDDNFFSDNDNSVSSTTKEGSVGGSSSSSKKRRKGSQKTGGSSKRKKKARNDNDDVDSTPHVRIITNHEVSEGAPKKIIIKFGGLSAMQPEAATTSPPPPPLATPKPPKSKRNMNHELDKVTTTKITPIRLKVSRTKEGFVAKSSCVEDDDSSAPTAAKKKSAASSAASDTSSAATLPKHVPSSTPSSSAETNSTDTAASAAMNPPSTPSLVAAASTSNTTV